jgi:hypothetical protein
VPNNESYAPAAKRCAVIVIVTDAGKKCDAALPLRLTEWRPAEGGEAMQIWRPLAGRFTASKSESG